MIIKLIACAEHIIIDANSGRLSIVNMFEGIEAASFPLLLPNFSFVLVSEREQNEGSEQALQLKFFLNDDLLKEGPLLIDYGETEINRAVIELQSLIITHPGRLSAKVFDQHDGEIACWSFAIDQDSVPMTVNNQDG
jgi:hypothetical protein